MTRVVSVVIPTYNRGALLQETVRSVITQTFSDWELVIADDGSTDSSIEQLPADPRIRVVRLAHSGNPAAVINAGAATATGKWLAVLGSDDLLMPDRFAVQLAALERHPTATWSYSDYSFIDGAGRPITERVASGFRPVSGWILEPLLRGEASACIITVLMQRATFDRLGGFDEELVFRQDADLILRLAACEHALSIAQPLAVVREHPERNTKSRPVAELYGWNARVYEKAAARTADPKLRALCHRHRRRQIVAKARALARTGRRWQAALTLAGLFA